MTHWPVVTSVSQATRAFLSLARMASRTPSEIWSATLSGWPMVTDSLVNRCVLRRNSGDTAGSYSGKNVMEKPVRPRDDGADRADNVAEARGNLKLQVPSSKQAEKSKIQ